MTKSNGKLKKEASLESTQLGPHTNVDGILHALGPFGRYQLIQLFFILVLLMENSFHLISAVYIGYRPPNYACKAINKTRYLHLYRPDLENVSSLNLVSRKCNIDVTGNLSGKEFGYSEECLEGYTYPVKEDASTVTEWNLVCEGAEKSEFAQTLIMLGQAAGAAIFAPMSDKFGRKPCNAVARILYFLTALATVFAPNIEIFSALRFLQGTFQGGYVAPALLSSPKKIPGRHHALIAGISNSQIRADGCVMTGHILQIELLPKDVRHSASAFGSSAWATGLLFTTFIGYLCRDMSWRYMQLILALITCHSLFDHVFMNESLRWLLANGKVKEAEKIIRKASKMNNVNFETVMKAGYQAPEGNDEEKHQEEIDKQKVHKYSVLTIFKHKILLCRSLVLWFAWITNTLTYYGLMLTSNKLSGNRYLNSSLGAIAEYPAILIIQLLVNRIGRKRLLILFHGIAGVSMVAAMLCTTYGGSMYWLQHLGTFFSLVGRGSIKGSFSTVFLYTGEQYPTNLRNAGLGVSSTISRLGSMLSPFAMTLAEYVLWGPSAVFAVMNIIVTLSLLALPETMGKELPTTLGELKQWKSQFKPAIKEMNIIYSEKM